MLENQTAEATTANPEVLFVTEPTQLEKAQGHVRALSQGAVDGEDFLKLAHIVAAGLKRDGVDKQFLELDAKKQSQYIVRQAMNEMKRIQLIINAYLTNADTREAFQQLVFKSLKLRRKK